MLTKEKIREIFARHCAIIIGSHFVYAKKPEGWFHGPAYVNKDAIYPHVDDVKRLCSVIAQHFTLYSVEVVVGPTVGAVVLAQWTTDWLKHVFSGGEVLAVCADEEDVVEEGQKTGTRRVIKRGYDKLVKGKRCLIVEDIVNSGLTVVKTREAIERCGGTVVGVGCLCNRSGGKVTAETLGVSELFSLLDVGMEMFPEAECPICKEKGRGSVRLDLGKGKEFLQRIGIQPGEM
jgi:orotate phosphoribosyltransferase